MRVCVLHEAGDLGLEERPALPLGPDQVRVRLGPGGICGSDLHYYFEGRVGDFAVRESLILGHEVAGDVSRSAPTSRACIPATASPSTRASRAGAAARARRAGPTCARA